MAADKTLDFTNRTIKALPPQAPGAGAHADAYSDSAVVGLKLEVSKKGRKTFLFRFVLHGIRGSLRIGEFPAIDVAGARKLALEKRGQVDRGIDPREEGNRSKAMPTFAEFAMDEYMPYAVTMKRTANDDLSKLKHHLLSRFGSRRLSDIGRRDIELYHAAVKSSHTPATANRHLALLCAIFRRAMEWGRIDLSPCAGVKAFREDNASQRYLSKEELERFIPALKADSNVVAAAALMLLLLTGARRSEVSHLQWGELDLANGFWLLRGEKTKNGKTRRIALSGAAVALLNAQPSKGVSPWVFPGRDGPEKPIENLTKPLNRILAAAGVPHARVHSLRHTHASHLVASGVSLLAVRDALGHSSMQMQYDVRYFLD